MERSEAKAIVGALMAGWPAADVPQATVELYATQIAKLSNTRAAFAAVEALIESREWFPTFAAFREEYVSAARRMEPATVTPALESGEERPPVPDFVLEFAASLGTGKTGDPLAEFEQAGLGDCADCGHTFEERVRYGPLEVCRRCALGRSRVRWEADEAEKRPVVARASGPPVPQPNFKRMPEHKRGEPANEAWFGKAYR